MDAGDQDDRDIRSATAQSAAAHCVARVIAASFDACGEIEAPLSELQRVAILETALLEFDGFGAHLSSLAALDSLLRDLREL